jgi:hypothetical protein
MDRLSEKFKLDIDRQNPLSGVMMFARGILSWLIGFFTLTPEDRMKAGIDIEEEGLDD